MRFTEQQQREALVMLARGETWATVARRLGTSDTTLHRFLAREKERVGVNTTIALIAWLIVAGELDMTMEEFIGPGYGEAAPEADGSAES